MRVFDREPLLGARSVIRSTDRAARTGVVVPVIVLALLVAGCGDDDDGAATTTVSSTTSTTEEPTTSSSTSTTTSTADTIVVQVFFVDQEAFNQGIPPYATPVEREVDAAEPARGALEELFEGPTTEESTEGLVFVASEADGFADLRIEDGVAHVRLTGGCSSGGSTLTIAEQIVPTLLQFTEVDAVKIYDPEGETASPDEPGDSIPFCLEP